jgi:hypothetical protein
MTHTLARPRPASNWITTLLLIAFVTAFGIWGQTQVDGSSQIDNHPCETATTSCTARTTSNAPAHS